jgi:hypothetical protein
MVNTTFDASLAERVRRGEYEVDAHAVAEAMVRRWKKPQALGSAECARIGSAVLIAAQAVDGPAVRPDEGEPEPGPDVA